MGRTMKIIFEHEITVKTIDKAPILLGPFASLEKAIEGVKEYENIRTKATGPERKAAKAEK